MLPASAHARNAMTASDRMNPLAPPPASRCFAVSEPFAPRPRSWLGVLRQHDWSVRRWSICYPSQRPFDPQRFEAVIADLLASLPQPAVTRQRPGVAMLILHQGRGADYAVLAWWDQENELPLKIAVNRGAGWRPAQPDESICVWDLELLNLERQHYIAEVLRQPESIASDWAMRPPADHRQPAGG